MVIGSKQMEQITKQQEKKNAFEWLDSRIHVPDTKNNLQAAVFM